jgi:formylmethanofuran dehydrogenase subunit E
MLLSSNSAPYILNGTSCFTDAVAVFGATTGQNFLCRWMT